MHSHGEALLLLTLSVFLATAQIVELPQGRVRGADSGNYYSFTNLPYAEPPRRFERSVPYERSWRNIFDATKTARRCVPFGRLFNVSLGQEDCLTLNVYTPKSVRHQNHLPVFVYIHGGGFMFGSSSSYSPKVIMEQGNMVTVTLNYRLGPLGFLSTGDEVIQGNFGLKDQLLALRWIKQNIQFFGGDPERILLTGHSAGAASVHFHILRKETEGLISAAVGFSGSALNPWVMQRNARKKAETLAKHLNCPLSSREMKTCLQSRSIHEIHAAVLQMHYYLDYPFNIFGPVVESPDMPDPLITDQPRNLICSGNIANVPLMITFVTEDGAYNCGTLLSKNADGVDVIEELNYRWQELAPHMLCYYDYPSAQEREETSARLRSLYMEDLAFSRVTYPLLQKMFTDVLYVNGIREMIELHRTCGRSPIYGYIYANPHNYGVGNFLANDTDYQFGATHGDDVELIVPLTRSTNYKMAENDGQIARLMMGMLETLISNGTPQFAGQQLSAAGSGGDLMQYLQIFQGKYCIGPWESYSYPQRDCIWCQCYAYPSRRLEGIANKL